MPAGRPTPIISPVMILSLKAGSLSIDIEQADRVEVLNEFLCAEVV